MESRRSLKMKWIAKWRLMLTTLPYVAAIVFLRILSEKVFCFHGALEFSDVVVVMTGGVFLLGFMLTGTLSDYKESEKLPAELASTLEALEEMFALSVVHKPKLDGMALRRAVLLVTDALLEKLHKKI